MSSTFPPLDRTDHRLLDLVRVDAAKPLHEIGDLVGLSPSAVQRRLARLRAAGVIKAQVAVLDSRALGLAMTTLVLVELESDTAPNYATFRESLRSEPAVQHCYHVAGQWDFVVVLLTADFDAYGQVAERLFLTNPAVRRYETMPAYGVEAGNG
ncbi:Lrp/AsnC family transcriptional regulator [Actinoplanes sp. NPDC026623]|uniref:Lrp/AsnC family transcriptional regulator n=1 Tax=Actinoplanes sp. NPDC026623 TaxID=3155610 RepID=UPI0033FDDE8A